MTTTFAWGEDVQVTIELGFPVNKFTLDDATLGQLGVGHLDGILEGIDVSSYCQSVTVQRGRSDQLQSFSAGTCSIQLINSDRRFDPINESSPYWDATLGRSGVTPRRRVQVISKGIPLFTGRVTDIDIEYAPNGGGSSEKAVCVIEAADDFVLLANTAFEADYLPSVELSGARVSAILDLPEVNFSATARDIAAGTVALGDYIVDAGGTILDYLQQINRAEQGYLFMAGDGDLTFTDRLSATFATAAAYFADDGTNIPYMNIQIVYGQEFLYNKVIAQRVGGVEQVADDAASQTEFGISALSLTGLIVEDDTDASTLATDLLDRYSLPQYRFDGLEAAYNYATSAQQTTLSTLEVGDVISVTRTFVTGSPLSVTKQYSIEQLKHEISSVGHVVRYGLAATELLTALVLDDATLGQLDSTNALGPSQLQPFVMDIASVDSDYTFTA